MAQPLESPIPPPRLYTVAEYLALGETEPGYTELVEGRINVNPGPAPIHNLAGIELLLALRRSLPPELVCVTDIDVDLQLVGPDRPGFVRRPDLIVFRRDALSRVAAEGGALRASEVVLAVEIVSPSSVRHDRVIKRGEYADAGLPYYWIVDLSEPVSALLCHQAGELGYADGGEVTGRFTVTEPFPAEIDLDALR